MAERLEPLLEVEAPPPGSPWVLVLRTRHEEPRLKTRRDASATRVAHPGTIVRHGEDLYEVVAFDRLPEPRLPWRYGLVRFESGTAIRLFFDLTPEGLQRWEDQRRVEIASDRRARRLGRFLPLIGLLPGHWQRMLERETGLSALAATRASALSLLIPSVAIAGYGHIVMFVGIAGGDFVAPISIHPLLVLLADYLAVESVVRMRSATEPVGSLPVAVVVGILEETRMIARAPEPERDRAERLRRERGVERSVDHVTRRPAPGGRGSELRIETRLEKRWAAGDCILFEQRVWRLDQARCDTRGAQSTHVYELSEASPDEMFRRAVPYRPDETAQAALERDRRDAADRLRIVKPLLGFLPSDMQIRWRDEHGFDAAGATRWSIGLELFAAIPNVITSAMNILVWPQRAMAETLVLGFAGLCVVEGLLRLRLLVEQGLPSGSFLVAWVPAVVRGMRTSRRSRR